MRKLHSSLSKASSHLDIYEHHYCDDFSGQYEADIYPDKPAT